MLLNLVGLYLSTTTGRAIGQVCFVERRYLVQCVFFGRTSTTGAALAQIFLVGQKRRPDPSRLDPTRSPRCVRDMSRVSNRWVVSTAEIPTKEAGFLIWETLRSSERYYTVSLSWLTGRGAYSFRWLHFFFFCSKIDTVTA